ncbi:MAG: glutamyl-tRNA synthetase [Fusobacteria bacterium]|nr:MAG: glutamyl-tRNA synthetase [Fusobacteriota bacterium]KAF0229733.1 MAG: glutamyl-tRNA [Fusobacteriota bacterium]
MNEVRTRYAPSPTGYMHIGNLRTALYEYLIAKKFKGKFILRIEDTDQERLVEDSLEVIYKTLELVGIKYDEGPYFQSERLDIYKPYAEQLVEKGEAYYCFCTKDRLDTLRKKQEEAGEFAHYDYNCRNLAKEEIDEKLKHNQQYVIRQKMPLAGETTFDDVVYGNIKVDNSELEDQILLKTDGFPTYNFANVVDDHLMNITHVVRGSEYLSSTPKYNLLYNSFGWEIPTYVHLPLILNEEGHKLSKRLGDKSFEDLLEEGYLVEAVINFIALLGWSPGDEREFFTLKELEENFTIEGISKSPSVFDKTKLKWMNAEYIRKMDLIKFAELIKNQIIGEIGNELDYIKIAKLLQKRVELLTEVESYLGVFKSVAEYSSELYIHKKMKTDQEIALSSLQLAIKRLTELDENQYTEEILHDTLISLAAEQGLKNGQLLWPLRVALTGTEQSPGGAIELIEIFGKSKSINRINEAIGKLMKGE